jgi:hypothetical protein
MNARHSGSGRGGATDGWLKKIAKAVGRSRLVRAGRRVVAESFGPWSEWQAERTRCDCRQDESEHQDAPGPRDSWTEGTPLLLYILLVTRVPCRG